MTFKLLGHRGTGPTRHLAALPPGRQPENTLAAFRAAVEAGADGIECDVHLTKDGRIAVLHNIDNLPDAPGIESLTLAELQRLDPAVPSLEEMLDVLAALNTDYRARTSRDLTVNIELKGQGLAGPLAAALDRAVAQNGLNKTAFLIVGQDWEALRVLRTLDAKLPLAPTVITTKIYNKNDIEIPGYNIAAGAVPDPDLLDALGRLHDDIRYDALDLILQDMTPALIDFMAARKIGAIAFAVPQRRGGQDLARLIRDMKTAAAALPVVYFLLDDVRAAA